MTTPEHTDPADDPPLTIRRCPLDVADDPHARRYIRTDETSVHVDDPWDLLTGNDRDPEAALVARHEFLIGWPTQPYADVAALLGHERFGPLPQHVRLAAQHLDAQLVADGTTLGCTLGPNDASALRQVLAHIAKLDERTTT